MSIRHQVHDRFKAFSGELGKDHLLGPLARQIEAFTKDGKIAPKSIGVEYLESAKRVVLTLGYRDDEPGYPVEVRSVSLGKIDGFDAESLHKLEDAMSAAATKIANVICHELYVTEEREFLMVLMVHK